MGRRKKHKPTSLKMDAVQCDVLTLDGKAPSPNKQKEYSGVTRTLMSGEEVTLKGRAKIDDDALIMYENNASLQEIARVYDTSAQNVQAFLNKKHPEARLKYMKNKIFTKHKTAYMETAQKKMLENITDEKLENASVKDLTTSYGILYDKTRLENNQSTINIEGLIEKESEANEEIDAKTKRLEELEALLSKDMIDLDVEDYSEEILDGEINE